MLTLVSLRHLVKHLIGQRSACCMGYLKLTLLFTLPTYNGARIVIAARHVPSSTITLGTTILNHVKHKRYPRLKHQGHSPQSPLPTPLPRPIQLDNLSPSQP